MPSLVRISRFRQSCALALAAMAGACGSSASTDLNVLVIGTGDDSFETDTGIALADRLVRASIAEGLVAFDAEGRVVPAAAERWIITDDGESYIFRMRDGNWRDGSPITARSAVQSLHKAIAALRGTPLYYDLADIEDIREMAGRVIEIRLNHAMPNFLQLLAQPELGLMHKGKGAGPMDLKKDGDVSRLTPMPPDSLDTAESSDWSSQARSVRLATVNGEEALRRFNDGEADLILGGRIADFPRTASVGILRGTIQLDAVDGLFGLRFMHERGFLSDVTNREAIAMAVNRDALIAPFGLDGWTPTTRIVPAKLQGSAATAAAARERWTEMPFEGRRALARSRVARWKQQHGEGKPLMLAVWLAQGPGSDLLFREIAADMNAIGVTLTRAGAVSGADMAMMDAVARNPSAIWFLNRFNCAVRKGACEPKADALVAQAMDAEDAAEADKLIDEAETVLMQANVFVPFGSPVRWSLVRGNVSGFATNRWAWHPLMPMTAHPK